MKKIFFAFAFFFTVTAYTQNSGIGFRLGDLSGITYKHYSSGKAFELSLGRTYLFIGDSWYHHHFNTWYDRKKYNYEVVEYINYYRETAPLGLQLHFMKQSTIEELNSEVGKLDWYLGFGAQFRYQSYNFDYRYKLAGDPTWYYVTDKYVSDIDVGPDGTIGVEYTFSTVPVSVFLDFTLFMQVYDDPFHFNGEGGIGVRYNF